MTPAEKVAAYIKLRDFKKNAEKEFKDSMERPNKAMETLEAALLDELNRSGADSLSCPAGTVYKNMQLNSSIDDRVAFLAWLRANGDWEALDAKANKTFLKEFMEKNGDVPPGVKVSQIATVGIRRS